MQIYVRIRIMLFSITLFLSRRDPVTPSSVFKIILLGDSDVGKTSFIRRYKVALVVFSHLLLDCSITLPIHLQIKNCEKDLFSFGKKKVRKCHPFFHLAELDWDEPTIVVQLEKLFPNIDCNSNFFGICLVDLNDKCQSLHRPVDFPICFI